MSMQVTVTGGAGGTHHHPEVAVHGHISTHSGKLTGHAHIHSQNHYEPRPLALTAVAVLLTIGIVALITSIALLALGATTLNPMLLFGGMGLLIASVAIAGGGVAVTIVDWAFQKHKKDYINTES